MSKKSIAEYVTEKRRVYTKSGSAKRTRLIDEVCETLGYTRKYVIKLLTGNIRYRDRKGQGKPHVDSVLANARRLWEVVGCPRTTYFVAELPRIVREFESRIALIKPKEGRESILALSASTLDRAFRELPRTKPSAVKSNRRSGPGRPIPDAIECKSGEETMARDVRPGDTQIDIVAHCGGDMRGNFCWTPAQTDRNTQWTEITPTWNRGMHNTVEVLKWLEAEWSNHCNFIRPAKMIVAKTKKPDGKGFVRKSYKCGNSPMMTTCLKKFQLPNLDSVADGIERKPSLSLDIPHFLRHQNDGIPINKG